MDYRFPSKNGQGASKAPAVSDASLGFAHSLTFSAYPTPFPTWMPQKKADTVGKQVQLIRNQPEWWQKIQTKDGRAKLRKLILGGKNNSGWIQGLIAEREFDVAIKECKWFARMFPGPSRPAAVDYVFARDDMSEALRTQLLKGVAQLRSQSASGITPEDRHPGAPQIIDLVHQSLFAYQQGVTSVLYGASADVYESPPWNSFVGLGHNDVDVNTGPRKSVARPLWLPSEFAVSHNDVTGGLKCKIGSYINSLHPIEYTDLYEAIGELFVHVLPLFEDVLAEVNNSGRVRKRVNSRQESNKGLFGKTFIQFECPRYDAERQSVTLRDRPLQVIVKLATLELGPRESYTGGWWHVEGIQEEFIVATACCYVSIENIQGGELCFDAGECVTSPGRVLAWPNILQHKVNPAKLVDPTLPGHRTVCCFLLIDPSVRVRSTATVPPQQHDWVAKAVDQELESKIGDAFVRTKITDLLISESCMTYEMACQRRETIVQQRRHNVFAPLVLLDIPDLHHDPFPDFPDLLD